VPIAHWRTYLLAAENVVADRWVQRDLWGHLPTLVGPGAVLAAAGTALVGLAAAAQEATGQVETYRFQGACVALLALALAVPRRYPRWWMAAVAVPLSGSMISPLPRSTALDWASYRHGSEVLPTDYVGAPALFVTATLLPLALVPLAFRRGPIGWRGLADAIRSTPLSRRAWPALSAGLIVLAPTTLVNGLQDPALPGVVKAGIALNALGMALAAIGIRHTVRGVSPAGAVPG
jgi:hypothetical protein